MTKGISDRIKTNLVLISLLILPTLFAGCSFQTGCTGYSATNISINQKAYEQKQDILDKLSFDIKVDRRGLGKKKAMVILALSGGGSRAAYFSTSVMFALSSALKNEHIDILKEVDVISAVSGGALPAAYYAFSSDQPDSASSKQGVRYWEERSVKELMTRRYRSRWIANWLWPINILKFWLTAYDRTDIMAETLSNNLFNDPISGKNYVFSDINKERPNLIINATNGTRPEFFDGSSDCRLDNDPSCSHFGDIFSFTREYFEDIGSDITEYELGRAVVASAAFPAVFNFTTLYNKKAGDKRYLHLFDGGNSDNLGLESTEKLIRTNIDKYDRIIVILVDAYIEPLGVSGKRPDGRNWFSYIIDSDVIDSSDSLLKKLRYKRIQGTIDYLQSLQDIAPLKNQPNTGATQLPRHALFYHIKLQDKKFNDQLFRQLNEIKTDFEIDTNDAKAIDDATKIIITKDNSCIRRIHEFLSVDEVSAGKVYCM
ncbi:patatin-like phospholipase family protein [Methylocaldum sp.]|uniref:patatin-like phospholipase family protein n=1 Tax=Methylocaldum sp. TaxID=1969727 RepID=UPI002D2CEB7E|nr:patatin-like phospholipase family protein [Methylocaldum sp.]HYE34756.1 patatin-like phospholipase family protein [Methylocaldum sp.]